MESPFLPCLGLHVCLCCIPAAGDYGWMGGGVVTSNLEILVIKSTGVVYGEGAGRLAMPQERH